MEGLDAGVSGVVGVRLLPPRCLAPVNVTLGNGDGLTAALAGVAEGDKSARDGQPACEGCKSTIKKNLYLYC